MALKTQERIILPEDAVLKYFLLYNERLETRIQHCVLESTESFKYYDQSWKVLDYLLSKNRRNKRLYTVTTSGESLLKKRSHIQYNLDHVGVLTSLMVFSTEELANKYVGSIHKLILADSKIFEPYCFGLRILGRNDPHVSFEIHEKTRGSILYRFPWKHGPTPLVFTSTYHAVPLYIDEKDGKTIPKSPVEYEFVLVPETIDYSDSDMVWKPINIRLKRQLECGLSECHKQVYTLLCLNFIQYMKFSLGKKLSKYMIKSSVLFAVLNSDPSSWKNTKTNFMKCLSLCSGYLLQFLKSKSCPHPSFPGCNHVLDTSKLKLHNVYLTRIVSKSILSMSWESWFDVFLQERFFTNCELFVLDQMVRFETNQYCTNVITRAKFGHVIHPLDRVTEMLYKVCQIGNDLKTFRHHRYLLQSIYVQHYTVDSHIPHLEAASYDLSTKLKTICIFMNSGYTQNALRLLKTIDCTLYHSFCGDGDTYMRRFLKTYDLSSMTLYDTACGYKNLDCETAFCIEYYDWDFFFAPTPLKFALHAAMYCRKNGMPVTIHFEHLLHYVKFVINDDKDKLETRDTAFSKRFRLAEDPSFSHKDVFLRLLGHCCELNNQTQNAFVCYVSATCHDWFCRECYWQAIILLWDVYFRQCIFRMVFYWSTLPKAKLYPDVGNLSNIKSAGVVELVKTDFTVERIVWEIPGNLFPTFSYTFEDICEIVHSIRGEYVDRCKSTDKLESLCSNLKVMANTVRVVFLSATTEKEYRILESVTRHFKPEDIIQKAKGCTLLGNLKEEYKTNPFLIISTCNENIANYFQQHKILSRIIFLSDHSSRDKCARNQSTLHHTTVANLLDKVDDLLEYDFLSIFAQIIHNFIDDCEDDERTRETVRFANAIYQRSGLPESERPKFKIGKISQVVPIQIKHEIVEIDQVIGCGEEGGVLTIDIKKTGCNSDDNAKRMVTEVLQRHGIEEYHIYFSQIETHVKVEIQSGEACKINNQNGKYGTLGAFMIEDLENQQPGGRTALSVLCAGHVVENDDNAFLQAQHKNVGKVSCKYDGTGMDIAKVRVEEEMLTFVDVRFRNEANEKMIAKLYDKDPSDSLLGRRVFLRGASTPLGLGKISSSEYISRDKCRILKIRKRQNESYYAEKGDSGATVLSLERKGKYLEALGMHLSQSNRPGSPVAYQAIFLKDGINHLMSRDAGPPLRLASSCEVEPHIHFDKVTVAVVEITRKYIRGVQATDAHITENSCTNVKDLELLSNNLKPGEIVDKTLAFIQPIWADGLHTLVVIVTDVIDKATFLRMNAAECIRMTHREAIEYSCTSTDKQIHVLLNVDDSKISYFTSPSSQQLAEDDAFDVNNIIQRNCLEKIQKKYEFQRNDQRDGEMKNVVQQFTRKLATFDGDTDIHISVLDPCNVNVEKDKKIIIPKAVVNDILKTFCQEFKDKVLATFTTHRLTGNAVVHVYGVFTLCSKLQEMLPNTFGQRITMCTCVMELPKRVLHKAARKRLKCHCALGLQGMPKPLCYRPWKK